VGSSHQWEQKQGNGDNGVICNIKLQNTVLEQVAQKYMESHDIPTTIKIRVLKALVWPVATYGIYGCESWTLI